MTESHAVTGARGGIAREKIGTVALRAGQRLGLAAAPTFAAMAILAALPSASPTGTLCPAGQGAPLLGGMATMYVLMAVFHMTPWLRLIAIERAATGADRAGPMERCEEGSDKAIQPLHGTR